MTIQPITSASSISSTPASARITPAQKLTEHQTPQDIVQLSKQAQAALDLDHDGDRQPAPLARFG